MEQHSWTQWIAGVVSVLGLGYILGFYVAGSNVQVRTVEHYTEVKGETQVQIVYRDRIVEHIVTKYPDGTVKEEDRTKDSESKTDEKSKTTEKLADRSSVTTGSSAQYSLGIRQHVDYSDLLPSVADWHSGLELTAGRRLLGPLWLEFGFRPLRHDISLGLSVEF